MLPYQYRPCQGILQKDKEVKDNKTFEARTWKVWRFGGRRDGDAAFADKGGETWRSRVGQGESGGHPYQWNPE
jgi:hypothetical protein